MRNFNFERISPRCDIRAAERGRLMCIEKNQTTPVMLHYHRHQIHRYTVLHTFTQMLILAGNHGNYKKQVRFMKPLHLSLIFMEHWPLLDNTIG